MKPYTTYREALAHPDYYIPKPYHVWRKKKSYPLHLQELFDTLERYNSFPILDIYDELKTGALPPKPSLFINTGVQRSLKKWNTLYTDKPEWHTPEAIELFKETLTDRLSRQYKSSIIEDTTLQMLNYMYPEATFYVSQQIDWYMGVDIVMQLEDRLYYLHITSNTTYAKQKAQKKSAYHKFYIPTPTGRIYIHFQRNFKDHIFLYYDRRDSDTTFTYYDYSILKQQYLQGIIAHADKNNLFEDVNDPNNQLWTLERELQKKNVLEHITPIQKGRLIHA